MLSTKISKLVLKVRILFHPNTFFSSISFYILVISNQEEEIPKLNASNSIESKGDFGESNNEVNNVKVDDASELRDPEASHFTLDSLHMLKVTYKILATVAYRANLQAQINLSIVEITVSEATTRLRFEIMVAQVTIVKEHIDKILKLGRRLASDDYNFCLKKMAKACPEVDIELLDQIEVSDDESREYEDDEDPNDSTTS
ncbi:hypothetical protein F0562_001653 [Nyssa sinensis]|uniref:Uncharacterized protein n=1 Tax=Nyssa sinensis TaxID=561372 RepID=A0A5J5C7N5_9ASTE|nr:hypothetical protein F0562_001653 [Nyssa sinensis]